MKINISPAVQSDIPQIAEIARESFHDPWSGESFYCELTRTGAVFLAAKSEEGNVIGYLSGDADREFGYIASVAAAKAARRMGAGTALLTAFENLLPPSAERITLEVRESNAAAIALYEKNGYKKIGVRKNFYSEITLATGEKLPRENAVIMERKLFN